jgi:hypothetical protein
MRNGVRVIKGKTVLVATFLSLLLGCDAGYAVIGGDPGEERLEALFRKHTANGNHAVAVKARFTI